MIGDAPVASVAAGIADDLALLLVEWPPGEQLAELERRQRLPRAVRDDPFRRGPIGQEAADERLRDVAFEEIVGRAE